MINLFFDVDDTLYDQLQPFEQAFYESFCEDTAVSVEEIYKRSRFYSDKVFEATEAGQMSKEDMHIYRISRALEDYGIRIDMRKAAAFQRIYAGYQRRICLIPEIREVLDWGILHAGMMGIITNGPAAHQRNKIERLGLKHWIMDEHIFISEEIKLAKPDVRLFQYIQEKCCLDPGQTYYIGDSYANDVIGAKQAGWNCIWINRRGYELPEEADERPDYIVKKYRTFMDIVQKLGI